MGRCSKANIARIGNLPKPQNTQKTTVEDISEEDDSDYEDDILLEHGFFFLDTTFGPDNMPQDFYFTNDHPTMPGWFKGMELIIRERGLWPTKGLNAQCEGFKCETGKKDCCCRRLLFTQPDFENQKSHLEEFITSRGHICDFYPKYHCELNFIEQYWGAAKLVYRNSPKTKDMNEMEENVKNALDNVPIVQIRQYANRAARFISAYGQGLSGPEAAWANRKYHGHHTLPPEIAAKLKSEHEKKYPAQPSVS